MVDRFVDFILDVLLSPGLWLSVALALVCSLLFFFWQRGELRQFGRDLGAASAGFAAGQVVGLFAGPRLLQIGTVHVVFGVVGALLGLWLGRRLWPAH